MFHVNWQCVKTLFLFSFACAIATGADRPIERLYVFGDSYSDTGNGYIDGNGPTAVSYFAKELGLKLLAANDPNADSKSSLNFAVSGAGSGKGNGRTVGSARLGIGMENQVDDFAERVRQKKIRFNAQKTLFYIAGGLNDRRLESAETVRNLEARIRMLAGLGARRFAVALLPTAIPSFREVGLRLNPALLRIPDEVKKEVQVEIRLSQWGPFFDRVMERPQEFGITNTTDACAGRAIFNENTTPCKAPDAHYYYHANHPSTAVHRAVGKMLAAEFRGR
jgi:cholinesterase